VNFRIVYYLMGNRSNRTKLVKIAVGVYWGIISHHMSGSDVDRDVEKAAYAAC
jgi:hypothetical protein